MTATMTADELAGMQTTQEENLPDVCKIISIAYTKDVRGNESEVPVTSAPFACRVQPLGAGRSNGTEGLILQRLGVLEAWKIRAPKAIAVTISDRIIVNVADAGERTMEIVAAPGLKSRQTIDTYYATEIK